MANCSSVSRLVLLVLLGLWVATIHSGKLPAGRYLLVVLVLVMERSVIYDTCIYWSLHVFEYPKCECIKNRPHYDTCIYYYVMCVYNVS